MMFRVKYGFALLALAYAGMAAAESLPEYDAGDLEVTASGIPQARGVAPVSVTVITAEEIANSSARTVQDVLSTVAGVHVFGAGGTSPTIDLRGFGMTGMSNTLILLDGVRQNTNDQSAVNLSFIPLASIERIEIVRGSGAVQYGDGATGGVINVITRAGYREQNHASITATIGSFALRQTNANFSLAGDRVSVDGFIDSMTTKHYRDNSAERRDGGGLGINWKLDDGSVRLYARSSSDGQGLAGARRVNPAAGTNLYESDPSGAATPYDNGTTKSNVVGLQADHRLGAGRLYVQLASRDKTTSTNWVSYSDKDQRILNEDSGSVRYVLPFAKADQWQIGYDFLSGDASTSNNEYGAYTSLRTISSSKQRHQGLFSEAQVDLWSGARATVGGRIQRVDDNLLCNSATSGVSGCLNSSDNRELHAWSLGLRQALAGDWSLYAKHAQSFRLPNADDVQSISSALSPQLSHDSEIGIEWAQNQASMRAALFRSDVTNEIHYLPYAYNSAYLSNSGANVNLDPTRHQGVELEGKLPLGRRVALSTNLTWQQATFRSGESNGVNLAGKQVPMTPSWLANLDLSWKITELTQASLALNYVGKQRLDNDQSNSFGAQLGAYTLVNARISHQFSKSVSAAFSVNNLFNRHYATYGVASTSSSAYNLYPGDPRNFTASATWSF
jgi:iron complex outermembrane receptor protein